MSRCIVRAFVLLLLGFLLLCVSPGCGSECGKCLHSDCMSSCQGDKDRCSEMCTHYLDKNSIDCSTAKKMGCGKKCDCE